MDTKHEQHIELHSKIWTEEPNLTRLCGYWEFDRYYQRFYHWLKTGVWPKRKWVDGLLTFKKHFDEHDRYRWCE